MSGLQGVAGEHEQKGPEAGQDLPEVVAGPAEDWVDRVTSHALEEVSSHQPVGLHVSNLWLHRGPPSKVTFEGVAEFPGAPDEDQASFFGNPVPPVVAVNEGAGWGLACELLYLVKLAFQGVAVVGVVRASLDTDHEAFLVRDDEADLHPELIGVVGHPLGDVLHFGGMQAVYLALGEPGLGEDEFSRDHGSSVAVVGGLGHLPFDIPQPGWTYEA